MTDEKIFRCPFEVQGIAAGAILDVTLDEDRRTRLMRLRESLARLKCDHAIHSVRFILPASVLEGCDTLEALRERILPYQAEFLAADIDCLLYPHMPYHSVWERFKAHFRPSRRHYRYAARALEVALMTGEYGMPASLVDLAEMIEAMFLDRVASGDPDPMFIFGSLRKNGEKFWLFRMERGAFSVYHDQDTLLDPSVNDAHFSIIKAPLYPNAFGRYSDQCEIVVTRDVDVARLPETVKMRIRRDANLVHRMHGVPINNLLTQQPTGLWIPED